MLCCYVNTVPQRRCLGDGHFVQHVHHTTNVETTTDVLESEIMNEHKAMTKIKVYLQTEPTFSIEDIVNHASAHRFMLLKP